jgi:hypothetical protein
MERWLPRSSRPGRTVPALLLAFFLVGSAVELHPGEETHGEAAASFATLFVASASHPEQDKHVESSSEASSRHPCAACLHNLLTAGIHLEASPHTAPSLAGERVLFSRAVRPTDLSRLPNGARAPPQA